jgi:glucokinase
VKSKFSIGIDLGGTKIAAGLVNPQGRILKETIRPSLPGGRSITPSQQLRYIIKTLAEVTEELSLSIPGTTRAARLARLSGIGLASAGPMNVTEGKLIHPANFAGWKVVPIVDLLRTELKKKHILSKVIFQNDAIAAALGEGWLGSAKGCETYVVVTVGTGIGSGVILNGKPAQSGGMGSEWGHIIVDTAEVARRPKEAYHATVEGLASGTGMFHLAQTKGFTGASMPELGVAAQNGDELALEIFDGAARALAILFYNLSLGFHLEKIVVTGGLMHVSDLFLPKARQLYKVLITQKNREFLAPVVKAQLLNNAGLIGAARLPFLD